MRSFVSTHPFLLIIFQVFLQILAIKILQYWDLILQGICGWGEEND